MILGYSEQQHFCIQKLREMTVEQNNILPTPAEWRSKFPHIPIKVLFGSFRNMAEAASLKIDEEPTRELRKPKILVLDIECKPMKVWAWGLFDQNIGIDMIIDDWSVMSWAAKWIGDDRMFYQDVSQNTDYRDDELIVRGIWELLNECDVVLGQNSIRFDIPKLNGKFAEYRLGPPSKFLHIDTMRIAKKLGLSSKKLAFMTEKFNEKYKKLSHAEFPGFSLWDECLKGNQAAWGIMSQYNKFDVLSTESLYLDTLQQWDSTINYGVFNGLSGCCPNCGGIDLKETNYIFTKTGMFQGYQCNTCKTQSNAKQNLLNKGESKGLLK